jgi:diaminohydroxyphosphoribosylaminopyrimidine deaminase/5-amino-6-(5-phosphoribosylamino)uracil reductase
MSISDTHVLGADPEVSSNDARFMAAALALGRRGLGRTAPNPSVGALVVKDGIVVGRGRTADGGRPHAETIALAQAGPSARGATLYVTLEPCSHHGQTSPCCEAVVAAGISRLVYALVDPNINVAGRGAGYCRHHGLNVVCGVGALAAARDHMGHIAMMTRQLPMVTLKFAETADGYVAGGPHDPRLAITGVAANGVVHVMRAMHDAIMVGIGTILADDPLMTVRLPGLVAKPLRVVLDPGARTPPRSRLMQTADDVPVLVVVGTAAPAARIDALRAIPNVDVSQMTVDSNGRFDLKAVLGALGARGLTRIFSEGGPSVGTALLDAGLVDQVFIFTAPRPLGAEGVATLTGPSRAVLADPRRFRLVAETEIGIDRLRHYERAA